jgi:hypothetical protein
VTVRVPASQVPLQYPPPVSEFPEGYGLNEPKYSGYPLYVDRAEALRE